MTMQYNNKFALIRHHIHAYYERLRVRYLKFLGMSIGKKPRIGSILCQWPNKVILGDNVELENHVSFKITQPFNNSNYIKIGSNVFVGKGCEFNCITTIVIEDNCLIASNTTFVDAGHEIEPSKLINKQPVTFSPIKLEEDVWIGTKCAILQGVTIGKGSVVGAGSVVNKSIPAGEIWAGVPARFIRKR